MATQLNVAILPLERMVRGGVGTESADAYALYLRGLAARARRYDPASTLRAIDLFRAAVATDTTFAPFVRAIVPGLRHFWARLAPGRLYDVPVRLGWLDIPTPEAALNPVPFFL